MSFSERMGLKPVREELQVDSIDEPLRNALWDALHLSYWATMKQHRLAEDKNMYMLCQRLWHCHYHEPIDALDPFWSNVLRSIRKRFFDCQWHEVYDLIEFMSTNYHDGEPELNSGFVNFCNQVLERHCSAYRFVGKELAKITSPEEIDAIEEALGFSDPFKPVADHISTALHLLSDRESPDYRNSIKESISAVEAVCNIMTEQKNATLKQALKDVEKTTSLHPALKDAFIKLYGYTSNADGIRHALLEESELSFEDAKFMLVSCSAFVNYLKAKMAKT